MARSIFSPSWHNVAQLRPRLLAQARFSRHLYRGQPWHVVQDVSGGKFHRLTPGAYALVRGMDGEHTVQELWDRACRAGGDDTPTQNEVVELLSQLHANDLLHCDVSPDAAQVFERFRKQRRSRWKQRLGNPMSIRIPLIDPDALLTRCVALAGPGFRPYRRAHLACWSYCRRCSSPRSTGPSSPTTSPTSCSRHRT